MMPNLIPMREVGRERAMYSFLTTPWMQAPAMVDQRERDLAYLASHIAIERANNPDLASMSDAEMTKQVMRMPPSDKLVLACTTKDGQEIYTCETVLTAYWRQCSNDSTGSRFSDN